MAPELLPYRENTNVLALRPAKDFYHKYPNPRRALLRSEKQRIYDLNATSRLLSLPLELRDRIYEAVLIESTRWNKRHQPSCPDYPAPDEFEVPPFLCLDHPKTSHVIRQGERTGSEGEAQHLCARRTGLGLLLACRQIHEEAADYLFGHNTFCFRSAESFVQSHHLLSYATRTTVRSVSIMVSALVDEWDLLDIDDRAWRDTLFDMVASMDGLKRLELPRSHMVIFPHHGLLKLRRLEHINLLDQAFCDLFIDRGRNTACTTLVRPFAIPSCPDEKHWRRYICEDCWAFFADLRDQASSLWWIRTRDEQFWYEAAQTKLLHNRPTCKTSEAPHRMRLDLENLGRTVVRVWGLPRQRTQEVEREAEQQKKEAERQKRMELLAAGHLRRFQRPNVKYMTQEQEEARSTLEGPSPRHQRCRMQRAAGKQEQKVAWRGERREKAAKFEAVLRKQENKWQAKAKARSVRELQVQKKEAKKRVGKNA